MGDIVSLVEMPGVVDGQALKFQEKGAGDLDLEDFLQQMQQLKRWARSATGPDIPGMKMLMGKGMMDVDESR
jgi:signal recognition particle GTPase